MIETTEHVIAARRLGTLRDLGRDLAEARTVAEACQHAARILGRNQTDLPFSIIYLLDGNSRRARLAAASGVGTRRPDDLETFELDDAACRLPSVAQVLANNRGERVELGCTLRGLVETEANDAMVLPLVRAGTAAYGVLVAGINPHRQLDDEYRGFYDALADSVTTALASVNACEDERARADARAAVDRARTEFFSDISHEFRTPLTLMLGPLEEVLRRPLTREVHRDLAMVHRNALRLLNLVNALLDFSRIEAGRVDAVYQPTDLATLTAELACMFRSAIERAGLRLTVECPPLPEPVYVDRDMWEKIVLNLVSNAFKFTLRGEIAVTLRMVDRQVELRVRDTGVGIPSSRLPHIFERFHRTKGDHARAREGTGIGLALVRQLVAFHGGTITAESVEGRATTLIVSIPCGTDHLRSDQINVSAHSSTATGSSGVFDRASQWVAVESAGDAHDPAEEQDSGAVDSERRPRIVCADDNADMRAYLVRLLSPRYDVEAVADGLAVLRATQRRLPDLVVADVMMPRMDGLALLRALRDDPATRIVPVLLLSARARDQSRVGGLESGADDYLVKPFSSRELLARVKAHVEIGRIRRVLRKESAALAAMEASEAERRRISRELHDELGQELTALVLGLKAARDTVPAESAMHRHLQRLQGMAAEVSRDMHRIALELRPGALDDQGLQMALSNYVEEWSRRYDIHADFQCVDLSTRRLPPVVETTVYRVVQEALANVGKHAKATTVSVVLQLRRPHEIVAIVEDDGCGFDPNRAEAGRRLGITGMKERAILVGGECLVESTAGGGTTILLRVPLDSRIHSDA